jgi:threonine/homoserine efflux transporter RhtA
MSAARFSPVSLVLIGILSAFYESFARIPLGVAVTIEFVGPLMLAAVGRRRPRDLVWVGLAALGVVLFGAGRPRSTPSGSAWRCSRAAAGRGRAPAGATPAGAGGSGRFAQLGDSLQP